MFDGARLIDRLLTRLHSVVDQTVIIASDADAYADTGVPVIADLIPDAGAFGALYTAVRSVNTDRVLVLACDMPFISERFLAFLMEAGRSVDIAIPRTPRGYEPLCATYSRNSAEGILQRIVERRFRLSDVATIAGLNVRELGPDQLSPFDPDGLLFFNINSATDFASAVALSRGAECGRQA